MNQTNNLTISGLYRKKKYGTWQPFSLPLENEENYTDLREYCKDRLDALDVTNVKISKDEIEN